MKPLIWVECHVERHSKTRVEYLVKARSQFKERSNAVGVEIKLPLPADATTPQVGRPPQTSPQTPAQTQWPRDVFVGLAALSSIGERIEFSSDTIRLNKVLTVRSTSVDPACDWLPLPAYTLSLSVIGSHSRFILSPCL